jgi:predicted transcriptional regulator
MHLAALAHFVAMQSFKTFQDLISGASSLADIDRKLDALLEAGKVDPALLLTTSKMYMSVKESPYTSEEVKDIMAHLYWRVRSPS